MNLTNRYGGIDIMWANLMRQDFKDWEWILVDALYDYRHKEVIEYTKGDPRVKHIRQNDLVPGCRTNLAHADNQGFAACSGELIVCLQDYIWIGPRGFSSYWDAYEAKPNILVTGVGNQFSKPGIEDMVDPHGKITVFKEPYTRRPEEQCWQDPRMTTEHGTFYMCNPPDWELNWASIPRKVIYELGGMDEKYDEFGFAWDNVNIAYRADLLGYRQYIDQTNLCMGFNHDGWWPNPLKVEKLSPAEYHFDQMNKMKKGEIPIKLNYLTE